MVVTKLISTEIPGSKFTLLRSSSLVYSLRFVDVRCDINGAKEAGLDTFYIHSNISPKDDKKPDSTYYLPAMDMKKVKELILQNASGTHGV